MQVDELLAEWRQTYAEWVSTELDLRAAQRRENSRSLVPLLEERIRVLKRQCSDCQDALSNALAAKKEMTS